MVVQGMGGIMSITGHPGGPPTRVGMSVGDIAAGLYTAIARQRRARPPRQDRRGDQGRCRACSTASSRCWRTRSCATRRPAKSPARSARAIPSITPFEAFATADGYIIIAAGNDGLFVKLCEALGRPELADNPLYKTNALRNQHQTALQGRDRGGAEDRHTDALARRAGKGAACRAGRSTTSRRRWPTRRSRRATCWSRCRRQRGTLKLAGNPMKLSAFADPPTRAPAPDLDADRAGHPVLARRLRRARHIPKISSVSAPALAEVRWPVAALALLIFLVGAYLPGARRAAAYRGRLDSAGLQAPVEIVRDATPCRTSSPARSRMPPSASATSMPRTGCGRWK